MAKATKEKTPKAVAPKAEAKAEPKTESKTESKTEPKTESKSETKAEPAKAEATETKSDAPKNYSRGEGQKPVTQAYKDNWNAIYGKKKKR